MSRGERDSRDAFASPPRSDRGVRAASLDRALLDWAGARQRVSSYLRGLGLSAGDIDSRGREILERALGRDSTNPAVVDALDEVPPVLMERHSGRALDPVPSTGEAGSCANERWLRWRFAAWQVNAVGADTVRPPASLVPTPPLSRGAMIPEYLPPRDFRAAWRARASGTRKPTDPDREARARSRSAWRWRGFRRRMGLLALVSVSSVLAGSAFLGTLPAHVSWFAESALAIFFGALFGWISMGFWTAVVGFVVLLRGGDRFAIAPRIEPQSLAPLDPVCRTALVMPICDEPVARVFAGLRAIRASLERAGASGAFDIFILSDSVDPDVCSDEEAIWAQWQRDTKDAGQSGGGLFFRRRRVRQKRKSGNVADFCRRYGRRYRYMVVLDADSVMSGEALVRLVRTMESRPHVGIIQTAPKVVRAATLFARVQQFSSRLYGSMFAAGLHFWQLGDSPYWGHNAILRIEPFMRHCALARLSGRPPFGGDILSHDFVEAALLGRAGWSVWLAYDLPGSYEEAPGSLLEEMQRDQRWCQGNLQHLRLLFTKGLVSAHRALFLNGVFAYVSAVLWLGFLVASTAEALLWATRGPDYFAGGPTLFPTWPIWRPERVEALFGVVMGVLFLPKLLAIGLAIRRGEAPAYGGVAGLLKGFLVESLASALFAPIRMTFYCRFVLQNLLGRAVGWRGGADEQGETTWWQAWRHHGLDTAVASVWASSVYWLYPEALWWLTPVVGALILSVPLSVLASRASLGTRARAAGLLVTPEETQPPREIEDLEADLRASRPAARRGFVMAIVDPLRNALLATLRREPRTFAPGVRAERDAWLEQALRGGPDALTDRQKRVLLTDARALVALHERVWRLEDREAAERWALTDASRAAVLPVS